MGILTELPQSPNLDAQLGETHPLGAFSILAGGDAFEMAAGRAPAAGAARAEQYAKVKLRFRPPFEASAERRVRTDIIRLIQGSLELLARLEVAKPIEIDLLPPGKPFASLGYPKSNPPNTIGLFWDDRTWDRARIGLRREKLDEVPQLAIHEMAHAIHHLAFTEEERDLIRRVLVRTFRTDGAIDEAFAIYSEREFLQEFTDHDKRAPGVYGFARQRWSEDHVFTRFVRNLYFPYRPLAGPKATPLSGGDLFGAR